MIFKNISNFTNTTDYLPILNAAIITDLIVIIRLVLGYINSKTLKTWYNKYGVWSIIADVFSIIIGLIITRFIYPFIFTKYSIVKFCILAVFVQVTHDLLFAWFFQSISKGKSQILDTFKDYANELGPVILLADALMMISTILIGSLLASFSLNTNIIILIISLYIIPYFLYSIH